MYFFTRVETDVVIFEDIDRFGDPHIFDTLRELNTILLNARQPDGRQIRFVYAIKDSIFEQLGNESSKDAGQDPSDAELNRANRTKFFDLVIPLVPFITHRNARDLMTDVLGSDEFDPGLIDLASRHLTDMRLLKNIHNEYLVFGVSNSFVPTMAYPA